MALNDSWTSIVSERRDLVASLVVRQLTQREICKALKQLGKVHPETGKEWSVGTINTDIKHLKLEWRASARASIEQHQADRLRELAEVKKAAWERRDLDKVLRAIKQECDILGLEAPIKLDVTLQAIADEFGLTPAEIIEEAESYLREASHAR